MKKKIFISIVLMILLFSTACSNVSSKVMTLSTAKLTEQEMDILALTGSNSSSNIFEYQTDKDVKSLVVKTYKLNANGAWEQLNGHRTNAINSSKGRIFISFDIIPQGVAIGIQDDKGTGYTKDTAPLTDDFSNMSKSISHMTNPANIEYEKEIPIAIQILTTKDRVISHNVDYFYQPEEFAKLDYEHVYALTITFSQQDMQ